MVHGGVASVLVVDDDLGVLRAVCRALLGHQVTATDDPDQALALLGTGQFEAMVTDLDMPRMHGAKLIAEARRLPRAAGLAILVLTGEAVSEVAGARQVLRKPADPTSLCAALEAALACPTLACARSILDQAGPRA
ncbi:MAG: response regulator [Myxococcales bacterium]|nr:response regulator [Myxococcales bacterium]